MALPAAVTTIPVHLKVTHPSDGSPAVGTVTFAIPQALRDVTDSVVLGPETIVANLVGGEFTVNLIATDDPDIVPSGWTYTVTVSTDAWSDRFQLSVPVATVGTLELAKVAPAIPVPLVAIYTLTNDPRLSDPRTPTPHAASHATGGSDPITPAAIGAIPVPDGTAAVGQVVSVSQVSGGAATGFGLLTGADVYAKRGFAGFAGFMAALAAGYSTGLGVLGDSTGNETTEWPYLLAAHFGTAFPAYTVEHRLYNSTNEDYDAAVRVQTGAAGERYVQILTPGSSPKTPGTGYVTGDLDVRVLVAADNFATTQTFVALFGAAGNRSWRLVTTASGKLNLQTSADGTTLLDHISTVNPAVTNGQPVWLRATLDVDNGAAGHTVTYYQSPDGVAWTQVGTAVTTAGATGLFSPTGGLQYELGARQDTLEPSLGKFYRVQVRDGIGGGKQLVPLLPELWTPQNRLQYAVGGAPVLTLVNGSVSGSDIAYHVDPVRMPKLTPDCGQAVTFLSLSHNDGFGRDGTYLAKRDIQLSSVKSRLPGTTVALVTQNPKISPATYINEHALRRPILMNWAGRNGVTVVDTYRAFTESSTPLTSLIDTDGIHPVGAGRTLWYQTVLTALNAAA